MTCPQFQVKEINLPETRVATIDNVSEELLQEHLWLIRHEVALNVYYALFDYTSCSDERNRV